MLGKCPAIQRGIPSGLLRVGREEGSKTDMIQDLELNASTVVITIVVLILFALALRVAVRSWTGKRDCHGSGGCDKDNRRGSDS